MKRLGTGEQIFYIMLVCLILNRLTWKFGSGLKRCCVVWLLSFANIFDMSLWFQMIVILFAFSKFITDVTNYYYTHYLQHEWFFCCSFFLYTNGNYLKWGLWNLEFHQIKKDCNDYIIKKNFHEMYLQRVQKSTISPIHDKRCFESNFESTHRDWNIFLF